MPYPNIHDIIPKIRARAEADLKRDVSHEELTAIATATIREIDHHITSTGDIVASAPQRQYIPEVKNWHTRGNGRRRRFAR